MSTLAWLMNTLPPLTATFRFWSALTSPACSTNETSVENCGGGVFG